MNLEPLRDRLAQIARTKTVSLVANSSMVTVDQGKVTATFSGPTHSEFEGLWIAAPREPFGWGIQVGDKNRYAGGRLSKMPTRVASTLLARELIVASGSEHEQQCRTTLRWARDVIVQSTEPAAREVWQVLSKVLDVRGDATLTVQTCMTPPPEAPTPLREAVPAALAALDPDDHCRFVIGNHGFRVRNGAICHAQVIYLDKDKFPGGIWVASQQNQVVVDIGVEGFGFRFDDIHMDKEVLTGDARSVTHTKVDVSELLGDTGSKLMQLFRIVAATENGPFKKLLSAPRSRVENWLDPGKLRRTAKCKVWGRFLA